MGKAGNLRRRLKIDQLQTRQGDREGEGRNEAGLGETESVSELLLGADDAMAVWDVEAKDRRARVLAPLQVSLVGHCQIVLPLPSTPPSSSAV
jgi:hypothetical protein